MNVIDHFVHEQLAPAEGLRGHISSVKIALAQAVTANALAREAARLTGATFVDPGLALPDALVDELRDLAVEHAMRAIGLHSEGSPRIGEPLATACARITAARGVSNVALALDAAGSDAVRRAGGEGALPGLMANMPPWLDAFLMLNFDRVALGIDLRDVDDPPPSIQSFLAGLQAWPAIPTGPFTTRAD